MTHPDTGSKQAISPRTSFLAPSSRTLRRAGTVVAAVAAVSLLAPQQTSATPTADTVAATVASAPASTTSATKATARYWANMTPAKYEHRLAGWINRVRNNKDIRTIRPASCEDRFAESWARHLNRTGEFYHQDLGPIMRTCRQGYSGEILAKGSVTPYQMVQMWMGSPGHRELMLSRGFSRAGISAVRSPGNVWVGCIDLGRP